jgi:hypothetical protein
MRQLMTQAQYQLTLYLKRMEVDSLVAQASEATLLQALADLLLGALGEDVEKGKNEAGGVNELEDHR